MHSTCRIRDQVVYGRKGGRCEVKMIMKGAVEKDRKGKAVGGVPNAMGE